MTTSRSNLPKRVTQGYWIRARQLLHARHGLSMAAALRAIRAYRAILVRDGVGDEIYHASVEDTARGIVQGGYATDNGLRGPKSTPTVHKEKGLMDQAAKTGQ